MNFFSRHSLVLAVGLLLTAGTLAGATPSPRNPRAKPANQFERTKERIDALLKRRLNPDPLPANLANPFQLPAGTVVAELRDGNPPDLPPDRKGGPTDLLPPDSDGEALARYAASLKITGTVKVDGQVHLIINQAPYKVGELLPLIFPSGTVYLQIIRIAPAELTVGLNQAVQSVKFKN